MSLYRGAGGASDATDDSTVNAVAGYASAAASSATSAANSAAASSTSATAAASSASGAASSASSVATNATNAATSASSANDYAIAANASKEAAAASAVIASTKAGEASSNASAASSASATAVTKAAEAVVSADASAASAVEAAASAADVLAIYGNSAAVSAAVTSASNSASTATEQANNSAASATQSAASAALAYEHEQNSGEWATVSQGAANSAQAYSTTALAARDATLAAYDSFDDRYLGVYNTDPTLDNDGNTLLPGSLYFNSSTNMMMLRAGNTWVAAYTSGGSPSFGDTVVNGTLNVTGTITGNLTGNVTGSADTVTNGVYTVGDQTVAGIKTLSSNPVLSAGTANGVAYLNGSKVLTSGSALTFDGSFLGLNRSTAWASEQFGISGSGASQRFIYARSTSAGHYLSFGTNGTAPYIEYGNGAGLIFQDGASEQMRLTSTGLGIGTSSPGAKIHAYSATGSSSLYLQNGASTRTWKLDSFSDGNLYIGIPGIIDAAAFTPSGNLGLGVTPSAWSALKSIDIAATGSVFATTAQAGIANNAYFNGTNWIYKTTTNATFFRATGSAFEWHTAPSGTAGNAISFTQAMTLDASGNLGVGTTSPIGSNSAGSITSGGMLAARGYLGAHQTNAGVFEYNTNAVNIRAYGNSAGTGYITFKTGGGGGSEDFEAARIDSSGNLLVGRTAPAGFTTSSGLNLLPTEGISIGKSASINFGSCLYMNRMAAVGDGNLVEFATSGTVQGTISVSGSTVAYNTSSDYRLKNITGPITTSGAYIDSLNPVEGTWKIDGSTFVGLIAHEAQEVSRTQVATGTKDGEEMQGMSYSSSEMIANMIAELKALRARVAALESA